MTNSGIKSRIRECLPPKLRYLASRLLGRAIQFQGPFASWHTAKTLADGYDTSVIVDKVLAATLKVKCGEAAYERDSILFDTIEYSWPVLSGLMWAAARQRGRLEVLDFGGALGTSYFQNRAFLAGLEAVRWLVVEQAHFVECGQQHFQDECLRFYPSIADCMEQGGPNVVLLSGVLQYMEDPFDLLATLSSLEADCLIIDRTIVNRSPASKLYVQHNPRQIYDASYPSWSLSESELKNQLANCKYECVAEFNSLAFPALLSIDSEFIGYVFIHKK